MIAVPDNPIKIRGFSAVSLLIFDEAAMVPDEAVFDGAADAGDLLGRYLADEYAEWKDRVLLEGVERGRRPVDSDLGYG